jgi:hypothetical protein
MTPAESGDKDVEAGEVFVENIEKTGVRFCAQGDTSVWKGR